jgi:hypothetical protein
MITLLRRLLHLVRSSRHDADLRDELETHRSLRQDALERRGLAPAAAGDASRLAMGNVPLAVEDAREVWAMRVLDHTQQDVRLALRGLRRSPGFALVTVGTLALGIGANTALFSIFSSLILRPLPVRDPRSRAARRRILVVSDLGRDPRARDAALRWRRRLVPATLRPVTKRPERSRGRSAKGRPRAGACSDRTYLRGN